MTEPRNGEGSASLGWRATAGLRDLIRKSPRLTNLAVRTLGRLQDLRDRRLGSAERWQVRSASETKYWADALRDPGARERFADRLDPEGELTDPPLERAVDEVEGEEISVLDVGSGPLSSVGKRRRGRRIEVTPIDPLADDYARVLRECDYDAPVLPVACDGEQIVARFGTGRFDVAYSLNALDHSTDPTVVVGQMLESLKPAGRVAMTHMHNEGERNGYFGIHFWNFECRGTRLFIWNRDVEHDMTAELAATHEVEAWSSDDGERVHCVIRPHPQG